MISFTPFCSWTIDSSLWEEDSDYIKVFLTLWGLQDYDHIVRYDAYRISRKAHIDELRVMDILRRLAGPDERKKTAQEHDGRRIKFVEEGILILNAEKYKLMARQEAIRAKNRKAQSVFRAKKKAELIKAGLNPIHAEAQIYDEELARREVPEEPLTPEEMEAHRNAQTAIQELNRIQRQRNHQPRKSGKLMRTVHMTATERIAEQLDGDGHHEQAAATLDAAETAREIDRIRRAETMTPADTDTL